MAYNVDVYKGGIKLGSGTMANGSATVSSYTATASRVTGSGRNVEITATGGNNIGATVQTRVITDGGSTLTLSHNGKFS